MSDAHFGTVNTPVYRTSTILYPSLADLKAETAPYTYGRHGTPSTRSFEEALEAIEGAARCVSLPSGLNAIAAAILTVCGAGDHILMADTCYWPTRHLCDTQLRRFGIETTYYDPGIGAGIAALMQPNTRAVYCESPGSLTFEVQDIPAIAAVAHAHGAAVLADSTWATPLFFAALEKGVDLNIHAATKYIGGHSDVMMGTVSATGAWAERLVATVHDLGLYIGGDDCFLALRGLRTLAVRLQRHQENTRVLTGWLATQDKVHRILWPALPDDPGHAIWKRDFTGASGLFGIEIAAGADLDAFFSSFRHFGLGYSWGGYESLVIPARFTRTATRFAATGPVLRLHAGLEDVGDLIADLEAALVRAYR